MVPCTLRFRKLSTNLADGWINGWTGGWVGGWIGEAGPDGAAVQPGTPENTLWVCC